MSTHQALFLMLIALGALSMPLLSERIGWFSAPCEVLYGVVLAAIFPVLGTPDQFISSLSTFAFLFLMFLAGLEIDFTVLRERGPKVGRRALAAAAGIQMVAWAIVLALGLSPILAMLGGALSVSLLLVVLQQQGLTQTPFGQTLMIVGAFGEFLSIILLTGYDLLTRYGFGWSLAIAALKLLLLLVAGYVTLRALARLAEGRPSRFARLFILQDVTEVGVRAALAMMLCFAAIAVILRVEQILATFIAGVICSYAFRGQHIVTRKLITLGQGFLLPIFFITAGMGVSIASLLHGAVLLRIGLLLAILAVSRLVCMPLLVFVGMSWRQAIPGALLLSAPLTLLVAIAQVGISLGAFTRQMQSVTLGVAVIGAVLFPLLARPYTRRLQAVAATDTRADDAAADVAWPPHARAVELWPQEEAV